MKLSELFRDEKKALPALFLTALVARVAAVAYFGFGSYSTLYEYGEIADSLFKGLGFSRGNGVPTCVMAPIYPYYIFAHYLIFGKGVAALIAIEIEQIIISSLAIFPLFYAAQKAFNYRTALIAALIYALYIDAVYSPYPVHPLAYSSVAIIALVYLFVKVFEKWSFYRWIIIGLLFGLSLLLEPAIVSIAVFFFALAFFVSFKRKKRILGPLISLVVMAAVI